MTKTYKTRESNIELLRLISMFFILILHANYLSLGYPSANDFHYNAISTSFRTIIEFLTIVAVNVFVLISGWFGINPKIKGLINIIFQVTFLSGIVVLFFYIIDVPVSFKTVLRSLYPGSLHWFIPHYIGLYIISPVLNTFSEHSSQKKFKFILLGFFLFEFFYGYIINLCNFNSGYSLLSFIGLYLLAQFMRRHMINQIESHNVLYYANLYIITTMINALCNILFTIEDFKLKDFFNLAYNSPLNILASVFLLMTFLRLKLRNSFINWLSASCFSIYIIHCHPMVLKYYLSFFRYLYSEYNGVYYILITFLCILIIAFLCIIIDKIRIICYKPIVYLYDRIYVNLQKWRIN